MDELTLELLNAAVERSGGPVWADAALLNRAGRRVLTLEADLERARRVMENLKAGRLCALTLDDLRTLLDGDR